MTSYLLQTVNELLDSDCQLDMCNKSMKVCTAALVDKDSVESHLTGYQCKQLNCTMTIDNSYKRLKSLPERVNRELIVLSCHF